MKEVGEKIDGASDFVAVQAALAVVVEHGVPSGTGPQAVGKIGFSKPSHSIVTPDSDRGSYWACGKPHETLAFLKEKSFRNFCKLWVDNKARFDTVHLLPVSAINSNPDHHESDNQK
jgi:hypothetical protein